MSPPSTSPSQSPVAALPSVRVASLSHPSHPARLSLQVTRLLSCRPSPPIAFPFPSPFLSRCPSSHVAFPLPSPFLSRCPSSPVAFLSRHLSFSPIALLSRRPSYSPVALPTLPSPFSPVCQNVLVLTFV
ncbi:unnamed protein product [Closterium sp. NIES-53]